MTIEFIKRFLRQFFCFHDYQEVPAEFSSYVAKDGWVKEFYLIKCAKCGSKYVLIKTVEPKKAHPQKAR
jgi:hypothetical protein